MIKKIYQFGSTLGFTEGDASMSDLLGGKGANLAEMAKLGMPVPYGITIPTTECNEYRKFYTGSDEKENYVAALVDDHVIPALDKIVDTIGYEPLYSVRSGGKHSMPGMMDTLLNIGLTNDNLPYWKKRLGKRSALDCRRRQISQYGKTVKGLHGFQHLWNFIKGYKYNLKSPPSSDAETVKSLKHLTKAVANFEKHYEKRFSTGFPDTLREQLIGSIVAVFNSWDSKRAKEYRALHDMDNDLGTAVNIQMMVYGNMNSKSCSGVAFSRDPATGEPGMMGEFLVNAQGEDVVAGTATPEPLENLADFNVGVASELITISKKLEIHYKEMMDIEFTVENGKLWMLQCRVGKRAGKAAFRIAHDMVFDGLISKEEAVSRVSAKQYMAMKRVRIDGVDPAPDYVGIAAGGGLVVGNVVTSAAEAKVIGATRDVILVTDETTPEDFGGMAASVGILTRTGGATSHAAVVGRSLEKHCVVGCIDLPEILGSPLITIDGASGKVWLEELTLTTGDVDDWAKCVLGWAIDATDDVMVKTSVDSNIFDGRYIATGESDYKKFTEFLYKADNDEEITECYIDLTIAGENKLDADKMLWNLVGKSDNSISETQIKQRMSALTTFTLDYLKKKAIIVPSSFSTPDEIKSLRAAGWKVVARVETIEDLLESDGIVEIDEGFAKQIGGEQVAAKLFEMMEKAGTPVRVKPKAISKNRLVFDVLK